MGSILNTLTDVSTEMEYDFTAASNDSQNQARNSQCFIAEDAMDGLNYQYPVTGCEDQTPKSASAIYQTGPLSFSDLQELGSGASVSGNTSQSTSRRQSSFMSEETQSGQLSLPPRSRRICPIMAGQSLQCTPELCGPDAACPDLSYLPELEDCDSVPCIAERFSNSPELAQRLQSPPPSIIATTMSSRSTKKATRNPRQRSQRADSDDPNCKSRLKKAHSLVERRYRENLKSSIAELHLALLETGRVPSAMAKSPGQLSEEQGPNQSKVRKSDVMLEAVEYVHQTEVELRHMAEEIELLTGRVRQLEKLVRCEDCEVMKALVNCNL
jgi:Helix-loop-helix DNA-binding domain